MSDGLFVNFNPRSYAKSDSIAPLLYKQIVSILTLSLYLALIFLPYQFKISFNYGANLL